MSDAIVKHYKIIVHFQCLDELAAKALMNELLDYDGRIHEVNLVDCDLEQKQQIEQYNLFNPQYNQTKT